MTIEMGRNIDYDVQTCRYLVVTKFDGKTLNWWFDTKRRATIKFNQLRKAGATYFDPHEDPTI